MALPPYPYRGQKIWDGPLKVYIDGMFAASEAGSTTDAGVAAQVATGTSTQDAIEDFVADRIAAIGPVKVALDENYVAEGSAFADISKQPGVDPTGTTECAGAINSALNAMLALGVRAYARGTFKIASTVTIAASADMGDATFNWVGGNASVAVQVGNGISGLSGILWRSRVVLPKIINTMKTIAGWAGSSIGVQVINAYGCIITAPRVNGFVSGFNTHALGTGNVMNEYHLQHLENNKRNLVLSAGSGGWTNQNHYFLGSLGHESAEGANVSGARQIQIDPATNLINGNIFDGGTVEGNTAEFHLDCAGVFNFFDNVRWENAGGCRIVWRAAATRNVIQYGYNAEQIVETTISGATLNRVLTTGMSKIVGTSSKAIQWLENIAGSAVAVDVVMAPGANAAGADPAVDYRVYRTANSTKMKRAADPFDRLILDHDNGRVYFGNGTVTPPTYLAPVAGGGIAFGGVGGLYFLTDNTYDIGASSLRPRDIFAGRNLDIGGALNHDGSTLGFYGAALVSQPAANPDTSGATLAQLETEVNQLKALLRSVGLMAT